jgi:hypothetical protein
MILIRQPNARRDRQTSGQMSVHGPFATYQYVRARSAFGGEADSLTRSLAVHDPKRTSPLENGNELVARAADFDAVKLNSQSGI